ncbi:gamma-tubulin complex component 4-like isoform X2 [Anneissia japonica]|nr:gamma-tubulin complex component 4-like isoform X2 [Anneissia japonica]
MCKLGTHYKQFQDFIAKYSGKPSLPSTEVPKTTPENELKDGLYIRALCVGLDSVLDSYRKVLLRLEQEVLRDVHLPLSHIQQALEEFHPVFTELSVLLDQLIARRVHGCHLLEVLHHRSVCGIPHVRDTILQITQICHCVMYKQLTAWLLHGMLLDKYKEFYIHQVPRQVEEEVKAQDVASLNTPDIPDKQLQEALKLTEESSSSESCQWSFAINPGMLPSYIPTRVADKILFVGEAVQMFENKKQKSSSKYRGSILQAQEEEFSSDFYRLQQQSMFSLPAFEESIDKIRGCVAQHLWTLVVEDSDLLGQLNTLKDFFLLGRGELFLAFIDHSQHLLRVPPTPTTEHDVNVAFQQAAHKVLMEDEALSMFKLTIATKPQSKTAGKKPENVGQTSGWSSLGMAFSVQWPLHILFTQSVLDKYNTMFKFLLNVKRVQLELQQCWATQMQQKHHMSQRWDANKWRLRNNMAFLLDNLQYYLQVDVLESQFTALIQKIQSTRDFEEVRFAHDQFLASLMAQSFLLMKPVRHCLNEILDVCHSFCTLLMQSVTMTAREISYMERIAQGFNRQSSLLFKILSGVRSHQTSPHLSQFMLRLDFNKFYSQSGGLLGSFTYRGTSTQDQNKSS